MDKQLQILHRNFEASAQHGMESCEAYGHAVSNHAVR